MSGATSRFPSPYTGRFAPSPSGPLHQGSLYTAVASYLDARAKDGKWRLRIDDVDTPRVVPGAADAILRTLERLGLDWDGPVVYQSRNFSRYQEALENLDTASLLYACTCSRRSVAKSVPGSRPPPIYPGTCRQAQRPRNEPHALRIRADAVISFDDHLQGPISQDLAAGVGDFVLRRRDGVFAYHLACVIDDFDAGISRILRGIDLLDSTPRQIFLQNSLRLPTPAYTHIPVVVDRNGIKLSKQTGAKAVDECNPSRSLAAALALLNHAPPGELRDARPEEILAWARAHWRLERLARSDVPDRAP